MIQIQCPHLELLIFSTFVGRNNLGFMGSIAFRRAAFFVVCTGDDKYSITEGIVDAAFL